MAVTSTLTKSSLNLRYKEGVDENNKDVFRIKKFSNVKVTAEDQNIFDTAAVLGSLMRYPAVEIVRADEVLLLNE